MSLETWKKEFYPVEADKATGSDLKALQHALKKWKGLTKKNLQKHNIHRPALSYTLVNDEDKNKDEWIIETFDIADESCALCHRHLYGGRDCRKCPLATPQALALNGIGCRGTYNQFRRGRATPMIKHIESTLKRLGELCQTKE